jgi:aconitate hydratase
MGAECGVTTSVFPSDDVTREFLEAQQRGDVWRELKADADAKYDDHVVISLSDIEPLAAAPHSPGNIVPISSLVGMRVDQVLIGSCTNSSYRDLKVVAKLLEGRKIHPNVSFGVAPGSRQVFEMLSRDGSIATMISAGARILESACGFCIGNSMAPANNAISLRTSNRNFEGRCGTKTARVYLVSPEIAVVSAIYGRVVDPRMVQELKYPRISRPKVFIVDDSMFIKPPANRKEVQIIRGPGIGKVPVNEPLPDVLAGEVTIKVGDKISTDDIIPAGERLKYRSNIENYSRFVFERIDPEFVTRAIKNKGENLHNFIVAGESYGQGSSREHAAMCPMFLNVKAVIARSIERIHLANLINFGVIPLIFERKQDYDSIQQGDRIRIEGIRKAIENDEKIILKNETRNVEISLKTSLTPRQKQIILAGGLSNYITNQNKS